MVSTLGCCNCRYRQAVEHSRAAAPGAELFFGADAAVVQEAVERVEKESREGLALLDRKLDRQTELIIGKLERMGNTQAERGRTNWGVVISAASLCVALVAAVGAALVNPIRVLDQEHSRRLNAIEDRVETQQELLLKTFEMAVRSDERTKK